jgi:tRNA(Ile)-lysidine synthase
VPSSRVRTAPHSISPYDLDQQCDAVSALIDRVRRFIHQHDLVHQGARVVAAVSGGSDSMALACVLADLERRGLLQLAGIAHFNHQLRDEAGADERFVRSAAETLGVQFIVDRADVAALAAEQRRSIEDAARSARHAFFERARAQCEADAVALGHTRDDQAETFLLRLLRGAGPRGLSGMHPRHGSTIRPLLDCTRRELRTLLDERGVSYVEDATNADVAIPRNRVRAELIPMLAGRFNPRVVDVLADEASLARELWLWMDEASAPFLATPGVLDVAALRGAPPGLRRLVVWRALTAGAGGRHISFDHVTDVIRLISRDDPDGDAGLDLPAQRVQRIGGALVLTNRGARDSRGSANFFERTLSIPGETRIPEAECVVTAEDAEPGAGARATAGNASVAFVRRDLFRQTLVVRNRRPGDRFRPVGLNGWKKLQDFFVDRKLGRRHRDAVPLVVDETDRIVWVAGYGIDEAFRVTDSSQAVLVLRLTRS